MYKKKISFLVSPIGLYLFCEISSQAHQKRELCMVYNRKYKKLSLSIVFVAKNVFVAKKDII